MLKLPKLSIKSCFLFIIIGLSVAFPLGLYTLTIGPTRYISNKAHLEKWGENQENTIQKIIIILFIIIVFALTLAILTYFYKSKLYQKIGIIVISLCSLLSSLYLFAFKPELLISTSKSNDNFKNNNATEFYFGSYPDATKIKELKAENYTAIISLLHKMVIPAEPILIKKEYENTQDYGLKLISIPMLPWIIGNDSALIKIKQLAKNAKGKYYVHCYLGKDRVNVFRSILERENNSIKLKNVYNRRNLDTISQFERGGVYKLSNQYYYTPYPTDEEFFSFLLNGKIKTVISLMDAKNRTEKIFIDREQNIMSKYSIIFNNIPIKYSETNKIDNLLDSISKLPKPIVIHHFSNESNKSKKFIKALKLKIKNDKNFDNN